MLLRGGFVYLAVFGVFYLGTLRRCRLLSRDALRDINPQYQAFSCGAFSYLCAVAMASNFQLYFVQLQTAVPVFVVIGSTLRAYDLARLRIAGQRARPLGTDRPRAFPVPRLPRPTRVFR
jgi:hypothetical protein